MTYAGFLALVTAAVLTPLAAMAQTAPSSSDAAPRWTMALGGASMHPLHGDEEDEGPVLIGAVGYGLSRHLRVEGEFTWRTATRSYVQTDVFLYGGPGGIHGRADRTELGFETTDWTLGVNVIGTTGWRILKVFGGPGVVWHREDDRRYRSVTNCRPPIPSNGFECRSFDGTTAAHGVGLQLMAGLDLVLHRRVTLFVAGRGEYRDDLSMGGVGVMAGARLGVR